MQLVKAKQNILLPPLQIVNGIVERKAVLPILANVLIRKEGESITFLTSDLHIQITTQITVGHQGESATTVAAARKLLDILRALPELNEVQISLIDKKLVVQSGQSRFLLQTLAAEDFPTVATAEHYDMQISLPQKQLKYLFNAVHFSMAQQDVRYYLNGLLLLIEGKHVIAVATDGHRLAFCQIATELEHPPQEVIIPRKTIIELLRLLEDNDNLVHLAMTDNQIKFNFNQIELISKLVEGKFPDYKRVIPKDYIHYFVIDRDKLLRSLQRTAIMTNDKFKGVRCVIVPGSLKIHSTNADQEEAAEELEIDYNGNSIDIGFNITYLLDVLNNLKSEQVHIALGDANSSALITIPNNADFEYVVMPMRL